MKNKKIVLTTIGVATLLMAVAGATFAFFASEMNNGTKNITVGTATVSNVNMTNEMIGMSDILPGYESAAYNITASATITGEFTVPYTCTISQSSDALVDLQYYVVAGTGMTATNNATWTSVPTSPTAFLTGSLSQTSLSQTSTIKFRLHETGSNQTAGESGVNSTVTVSCALDGGGSLYYNNNSSANGTTTPPEAELQADFWNDPSVNAVYLGTSWYSSSAHGVPNNVIGSNIDDFLENVGEYDEPFIPERTCDAAIADWDNTSHLNPGENMPYCIKLYLDSSKNISSVAIELKPNDEWYEMGENEVEITMLGNVNVSTNIARLDDFYNVTEHPERKISVDANGANYRYNPYEDYVDCVDNCEDDACSLCFCPYDDCYANNESLSINIGFGTTGGYIGNGFYLGTLIQSTSVWAGDQS